MHNKYNDILSVCITVKNRSKVEWEGLQEPLYLMPDCINSLAKLFSIRDKIEIVVADWNSTDWPLREWMPKVCKSPFKIINIDKEGFSKGYGVNRAVEQAMGDTIFTMDADMILNSRDIVATGMQTVMQGGVYFPIPKYIVNKEGHFRFNCGVGNMFINKKMFQKFGGLPEYYRYGFEDSDFYKMIEKAGIKIVSGPTDKLVHPFHPQSLAFKEQFIDDDPEHEAQIERRAEIYKGMKYKNEDFTI